MIRLTLDEYEEVRRDGRRFFNAPGHETASGPWGRVIDRREGFVVVEKVGEAAEIAEREAPTDAGRTP